MEWAVFVLLGKEMEGLVCMVFSFFGLGVVVRGVV